MMLWGKLLYFGVIMTENNETKKDSKWEFEDYAFLITGIIVAFLLIVPEILYSQFGINILGGSLSEYAQAGSGDLEAGSGGIDLSITRLRALSPLLFLLTTTIVFIYEAYEARKTGGYEGSLFSHTFESLLEDAIYMTIMTVMVYTTVLTDAMYASWLTGPVSWVLFVFIFPLLKKKSSSEDSGIPWFLLCVLLAGVVVELFTRAWIAFPLSWLIICGFKFVGILKAKITTLDTVFNLLYYAFSIILMTLGIAINLWVTSWIAFPIALLICWILSKFGRFKKDKTKTVQ